MHLYLNDQYGLQVEDIVLRTISSILRRRRLVERACRKVCSAQWPDKENKGEGSPREMSGKRVHGAARQGTVPKENSHGTSCKRMADFTE